MKKPNPREVRLLIATGITLFAAVTYMVVTQVTARHDLLEEEWLAERITAAQNENLLNQKPDLLLELESIRSELPVHPSDKDLNSTFSRQLESLSGNSGLRLTGRTPRPEEFLEELDLYQTAIRCSWESSSEDLIEFLYQIQKLGAVANIRELRIQNRSGQAERLSGTLILEFVYARTDVVLTSTPE